MSNHHNHHNHPTHVHNFMNKHTAVSIFILIIGCFLAGYFVGKHSFWDDQNGNGNRNNREMMNGYNDSSYR